VTRQQLPDPRTPIGQRRDGRLIFPIAGGSGTGEPVPPTPPVPPVPAVPPGDQGGLVQTLTQDELSRRLTREKDQGGRAARKALAEKLGFADHAALEAFVTQTQAAQAAALTEEQRRAQELADRETKLVERETAAAARERDAARRGALVGLGATGEDLTDAVLLLSHALPADADDAAVTAAAEALKARRPALFGTVAPPPAPGGAPAGGPPPAPGGGTATPPGSRGLEMARQRGHLPPA